MFWYSEGWQARLDLRREHLGRSDTALTQFSGSLTKTCRISLLPQYTIPELKILHIVGITIQYYVVMGNTSLFSTVVKGPWYSDCIPVLLYLITQNMPTFWCECVILDVCQLEATWGYLSWILSKVRGHSTAWVDLLGWSRFHTSHECKTVHGCFPPILIVTQSMISPLCMVLLSDPPWGYCPRTLCIKRSEVV
jgi:hypothetical protein